MSKSTLTLILAIFFPLACGYFLSFFFRSVNAMIAPDLVQEFDLLPGELGLVTAIYFLGFALFQLPLGVLLDRFGPARVQSSLLAVAAIGAILFSTGETYGTLVAGRGLIGIGAAGALMSSFTAFALWFPRHLLPLTNGCFMGFGGIGALAATKPVEWVLMLTDWRELFFWLAILTAVVATFVRFSLPIVTKKSSPISFCSEIQGLKSIYSNKLFCRIAPLTITTVASGFAIQGLWAAEWLRDVAGLGKGAIASHLFIIAVGIIIGPIISGFFAEVGRKCNLSLLTLYGSMAIIFMFLQLLIIFSWTSITFILWGAFGFFINAMSLSYAILTQNFPQNLAGRLNTNLNMLMISFAFVAQYIVGVIIEQWPISSTGGYHPDGYKFGFGILLISQLFSFIWFVAAPVKFRSW